MSAVTSYVEYEERYLPDTFEANLTDEERGIRAVARALKVALSECAPTDQLIDAPSRSVRTVETGSYL